MIYALDSNIISEILRKNANVIAWYRQKTAQGYNFIIPPIAYYEIERGLLSENLLVMRRALKFLYLILPPSIRNSPIYSVFCTRNAGCGSS
jgi:predicted nucleic acid-binding protein